MLSVLSSLISLSKDAASALTVFRNGLGFLLLSWSDILRFLLSRKVENCFYCFSALDEAEGDC